MENLRVSGGIDICVNDEGEKITLRANDQKFMRGFDELAESLKSLSEDDELKAAKALPRQEQLNLTIQKTEGIMRMLDDVFGEGSCKKIFGDTVPVPYLIADFFDQLIPIINRGTSERRKALSEKYGDRKREKHV